MSQAEGLHSLLTHASIFRPPVQTMNCHPLNGRSGRRRLVAIFASLGAAFAILCPSASAELPAATDVTAAVTGTTRDRH